jgi:hypothetical protein
MELVIDPDVKAVAEFMQSKIEARKLIGVAESLRAVAPIIWAHYDQIPVRGIELLAEPLSLKAREHCSESRLVASESVPACLRAGDDSGAVAGNLPH